MNLQEVIDTLYLTELTSKKNWGSINPSSAYISDLLSCVMAGAKHQSIWITLQSHSNIVAVAALLDVSAVIITEGATPDPETIEKANSEGITLLSTDKLSFEVCGLLWEMGLRG
jgi:hypothetical protein